jgi:anti-sigma factor RsiW
MPPALDDVVLIAAVDGEAGADITAHLRACQHCAERARDFAELQGLLRKQLYRLFCPASDDLAALQQGLLNEKQRAALAEHLAGCPHCTSELRMLAQATSEPLIVRPPPASSWLGLPAEAPSTKPLYGRARRVVAELLSRPHMQLAGVYGGLRGSSHASQYA